MVDQDVTPSLKPGAKLGPYRIVTPIGAGKTWVVSRGENSRDAVMISDFRPE